MDSFNLQRFVDAQETSYASALQEIRSGRKRGHWMWYVFPQLRGLGRTSTSDFFGIASREEAEAYLAHPTLGARLRECVDALLAVNGRSAEQIFGLPDVLKLRSCLTLFAAAAPDDPRFTAALTKFYEGKPDVNTLQLLDR